MNQLYKPRQKLKHPKTGQLPPQAVVVSGKELSQLVSPQVSVTSALLVAALNRCITPGMTGEWWARMPPAKRCVVFHAFRLALLGVPEPRHYVDAVEIGNPLMTLLYSDWTKLSPCSHFAFSEISSPIFACVYLYVCTRHVHLLECRLRVSVEIVSLAASCPLLLRVMVDGARYCVANKTVEELKHCPLSRYYFSSDSRISVFFVPSRAGHLSAAPLTATPVTLHNKMSSLCVVCLRPHHCARCGRDKS